MSKDRSLPQRLSGDQVKLYRKLLKRRLTIPGFLPTGDGLTGGLWEDVHVFDETTLEMFSYPTIEAVTCPICHRAQSIQYNLKFAGTTEKEMYPEEFTDEMMAIKKKYTGKWKKRGYQTYPVGSGNRVVFSGLDPDRLVEPHKIERETYRTGLDVDPESGLTFVLNAFRLSLDIVRRHRDFIVTCTKRYRNYEGTRRLHISCPIPGYFPSDSFALSDQRCLDLYRKLRSKSVSLSNRVFLPAKREDRPTGKSKKRC